MTDGLIMRRMAKKVLLFSLLATTGCSTFQAMGAPEEPQPLAPVLVTANPYAPSTPTPFLPEQQTSTPTLYFTPTSTPTPVPTATPAPPWGSFTAPIHGSDMPIPPPMPEVPLPPDAVNILILGSDQLPSLPGIRTDTIMVMSLIPSTGTAVLISIPRDLYGFIPGWKVDKINSAYSHGGIEMIAQAVFYNLGIEPHHYVFINYDGFRYAIDLLGGIDVDVPRQLNDRCYNQELWSFPAGWQHMDGRTVMCYVRMRKATSDFDRMKRQQVVMTAIFRRLVALDAWAKIPKLYRDLTSFAGTDMSLGDILPLLPLGIKLASDESGIRYETLAPPNVWDWWIGSTGMYVLLPNRDGIVEMLRDAFQR